MTSNMSEAQKARWSLINQTYAKVCNIQDHSDLRSNTLHVIMHLGLQLIAKEEGLLDGDEWYKPECRDELLRRVRGFLIKHIK